MMKEFPLSNSMAFNDPSRRKFNCNFLNDFALQFKKKIQSEIMGQQEYGNKI